MSTTAEVYPLLSGIDSPADLRKLSVEQLPELCREIRQYLIEVLADTPGHFASSMGSVEITVALHYVYDTPEDRLVWDVGHQAYAHKILTGRCEAFRTIRQKGGLSGFPSPEESPYDVFTAGHASNSISAALGIAVASQIQNPANPRNVVAVIGDASVSGGLAFEGINNAANTPNNLLIVLNDNDMSIDRNVGSLNRYLTRINTTKPYNSLRFNLYKVLKKIGLVNDRGRGTITRFNNSLKSVISNEQNIFEGLNIRYFGPFDGHDVVRLVKLFTTLKDMTGPKLLHLRTVKGKGYEPAEKDPATWHAPGKFDPANGCLKTTEAAGSSPKFQDVFGHALTDLAQKDDKIVAITAAMPSGTSVSVMQQEFPDRVFDVGISEGHAVTFAGGLAKEGMRPVVAIYSSFLQRAYDHMIHDVAIQHLPVIFAIDRAGIVGEDGVTHHGQNDIAYLRSIPGMVVAAPSDYTQLEALLRTAHAYTEGPFAIRYPRGKGPKALGETYTSHRTLNIGKGRQLRTGSDVIFLAIGSMVESSLKAADILAQKGVNATVYDMIFAKPIDTAILDEAARTGLPIITVEDGNINGGMGSAAIDWLAEHGYSNRVKRIGMPDSFIKHGTVAELRKDCGMDPDSIAAAATEIIKGI